MSARFGCIYAMLIMLAACSGKNRFFGDGSVAGAAGSSGGAITNDADSVETTTGTTGTAGKSVPGASVEALSPLGETVENAEGGRLVCGPDAGVCSSTDAGTAPAICVSAGPRDCTSGADNDCDGQPDNVIDGVCVCLAGSVEPCDQHPGLDGQGECRSGLRTCFVDAATLTTAWSACEGAIGPTGVDSCVPGNDNDCDGAPNEGCSCVEGQAQPCGSTTDIGPCQIGTSACVGGTFGQCVGAVAPAARDACAIQGDDANCNGVPNEGCTCIDGATQPCGPDTDVGICQGGTRTCSNGIFGQCVGAVFPAARDCASPQDNDCDGLADNSPASCGCPNGQTLVNGQCMLPQGAACQVNGVLCTTGQCVDGVCCESLCQGVCTQCQAGTGRCIAPAVDPGCNTDEIDCDSGDVCRVADPIPANSCRGPGECATTADCGAGRPADPRTPCGPGEDTGVGTIVPLCGATGDCANPQVNCEGVTGTVTSTSCCFLNFPESTEGTGFGNQCSFGGTTLATACDGESDCPLGTVCCLNDAVNFNFMTCLADCDERAAGPGNTTGSGNYVVCSSPGGGTSSCPGERPCTRTHPRLEGWSFCRFP